LNVFCRQYALFCQGEGHSRFLSWIADVGDFLAIYKPYDKPNSREHISISIDPFTGRNPSYAFVDLSTLADAQRAIAELDGREMMQRPIKVKPGVASRTQISPGRSSKPEKTSPVPYLPYVSEKFERDVILLTPFTVASGRGQVFDRWQKQEAEATAHFDYAHFGKRLYVGNLPSFNRNPAKVNTEVKHFFQGFQVYGIGPSCCNLSECFVIIAKLFPR
jgi:hypothetical protein